MSQTYNGSLCRFVVISLCALLAACHAKPAAPPPVPVKSAPPKPVQYLPARQPGLWQTTISEAGSADTPQNLQICIDPMTDQHLGVLGNDLSGDTCKTTVSRTADGWELLAECTMGAGGSDAFSGSISGDFSSDYTMKVRSQTTGASLPQMNKVTNYIVVSKRIGPCAADQKPGDVVNDGVKINLFDMAGVKRGPDKPVEQPGPADKGGAAPDGE